MTLRVPKAQLPAELSESVISPFGAVPEPLEVAWHNLRVAEAFSEIGGKVSGWDAAR